MKELIPFVACVFFSAVGAAQTLSPVTVVDRNFSFRQGALPLGVHTPAACDVRLSGTASTDQAFAWWWYYRLSGDAREFALQEDGRVTRSATGNRIECSWRDVAARGLFAATQVTDVFGDGIASGLVVQRVTLTNFSASDLVVDVFAYADLDLCGSFLGDVAIGDQTGHEITDTATCTTRIAFRAVAPDLAEVTDFNPVAPATSIRSRLSDGAVQDLAGWSGNFGPGDYTAAFQWRARRLRPGESHTFQSYLEANHTTSCVPQGDARGLSVGGSGGAPRISVSVVSVVPGSGARPLNMELISAPPSTPSFLLLGIVPLDVPIAGLNLYVDPRFAFTVPAAVDAAGSASLTAEVPESPLLCGGIVYLQWFVLDPSAPSGLLAHTSAVDLTIGGW